MGRDGIAADAAQVAATLAAVFGGIGVDALDPASGRRYAEAPRRSFHRREVARDDHRRRLAATPAQPGVDGIFGRVGLDPLEARRLAVQLVESRGGPVEAVEVANEPLHAGVARVAEQVPVEARVVVPFAGLCEVLAHEQELLPGMTPHEGEVGAQVGEALRFVARHLREQRALAVHHFVVAQRQHEVLREGVVHAEGHLVMVVSSVDGLAPHVVQGVVHPAHVPLVAESESAGVGGPGDPGIGGRFLGEGGDALAAGVDRLVQALQEGDRLQVLAPTLDIRHPFALRAGVVPVEHRGDGIDPQAVDVVLLQPVEGVRDQVVPHLVTAVVEDQRVPVPVKAFARIGVLVERGAVESPQAVRVGGEVAGHPVENEAELRGVAGLDEVAELAEGAVAAGRRVETDGLIAPGAVEGILGDRHHLDVGEAHVAHVGHQVLGQLAVAEGAGAVARPLPGAEVDLVDGDGPITPVCRLAPAQPCVVSPVLSAEIPHHGRGGRRALGS